MIESIVFDRFENTDLNMYQCGIHNCEPGHSFGPAVRDHFLIHYILKGKGSFRVGENIYNLCKGQGFLICPGIITFYQADYNDPWSYTWVGFNGAKAELYLKHALLTQENPVFTYDQDDFIKNCLADMIETKRLTKGRDLRLLGLLHLFLSQLVEANGKTLYPEHNVSRMELYINKAREYIEMNYSRKLSISEMAGYLGIDRSYLGAAFKEHMSVSPQQYLLSCRMNKACGLMNNRLMSIGDIARSVGYEDQLLFSKMFKRVKGLSPKAYREGRLITGTVPLINQWNHPCGY